MNQMETLASIWFIFTKYIRSVTKPGKKCFSEQVTPV